MKKSALFSSIFWSPINGYLHALFVRYLPMRARLIIAGSALVLLLILLVSCHKSAPKPVAESMPPLGKNCTVQFRRDALGAASISPVPPLTGSCNGAETAIGGKLK